MTAPRICLAAVALLVLVATGPVRGATLPGGGLEEEYFVRQEAGEALLIRIDGREARFESSVSTIEGEVLIRSGVPESRIAPLFQYIPETDRSRQLDIRVTAPLVTSRSRFDMGLSRITVYDDRSGRLAQAYRWLSFGLEVPTVDSAANWSIKVNALLNAARIFEGFGMEELQLWSQYFVGHLTLVEMGDNSTAQQVAEELLDHPGARRQPVIRLAATRLRAEALAALRRAGDLHVGDKEPDPVQLAADETAALAERLSYPFERAESLFLAGADLADRQRTDDALVRFQSALAEAEAIEADDLSTRVRERMVEMHGRQGDVAASSEVLQAIESQLTEDGANDELAQNLLAQGRILNRTYRFQEAREVLRQALTFEHNSATRNAVRLELAEAAWAQGDLDETEAHALAAVLDPDGGWRRPTPVLDVGKGLSLLAGVQRERGAHARARETRDAQRRVLSTSRERTLWAWERALDLLAAPGTGAAGARQAQALFRQVREGAGDPAMASYGALARLWSCLLSPSCGAGEVETVYRGLLGQALPRHRVLGAWLYGQIQARSGQTGAAVETLETVIREMTFLRYSLPGALGDVSWRRGEAIGDDLLQALHDQGNPERHLLGLARLRWLRAADLPLGLPFDPAVAGLDTDAFRARLADREWPGAGVDPSALNRDLVQALAEGRRRFEEEAAFLSPAGLTHWLRGLAPGEAVLDWDLASTPAVALLGTSERVRRLPLANSPGPAAWRNVLFSGGAPDALASGWGEQLLSPLPAGGADTLFLADGGGLGFLPFEAMARESRHASVRFVRLAAFPSRPGPGARLRPLTAERIFLAGQPADFSSGFLDRLETGAELRAVLDRHVGPGLEVVQGAALLPDEFATPAFRSAHLVHLSLPARLDLFRPENSYLELSEERRGEGRLTLRPGDLADWRLSAGLVVLSQAGLAPGEGRLTGRPPLVAQALASGAGAVLLSAWPGEDEATAAFMGRFHDALLTGASLPDAVAAARSAGGDVADWARYQLWVE